MDRIDKLESDVKQVNLFVFDTKGLFVDQFASKGASLYEGYTMTLPLPPGEYDFVAWGNLSEDYEVTSFVKGKTTKAEAMLSLRRGEDDVVNNRIGSLFHGTKRMIVKPDLQKNQRDTIDLIKNTKNIIVTVKGLALEPDATPEDCGYACTITSRNGDYRFDNSIIATKQLHYIPQAQVDESKSLVADFMILRELETNITRSKLTITKNKPLSKAGSGEVEELRTLNLVELLVPIAIKDGYTLDTEDIFKIEIVFDFTNGTSNIYINGWEVSNSGEILTSV
jgi:hypothetical protein